MTCALLVLCKANEARGFASPNHAEGRGASSPTAWSSEIGLRVAASHTHIVPDSQAEANWHSGGKVLSAYVGSWVEEMSAALSGRRQTEGQRGLEPLWAEGCAVWGMGCSWAFSFGGMGSRRCLAERAVKRRARQADARHVLNVDGNTGGCTFTSNGVGVAVPLQLLVVYESVAAGQGRIGYEVMTIASISGD